LCLVEESVENSITADPCTQAGSYGGEQKNKKNTKQFVVPPALEGGDIIAYKLEFFDHRRTGHDLDKSADISRANER